MSAKLMFSQEFLQNVEYTRGKKTAAQHKRPTQDSVRSDRVRGKKLRHNTSGPLGTQSRVTGSVARKLRHTSGPLRTKSRVIDSTKVTITPLRSATMFQRTVHPSWSYSR